MSLLRRDAGDPREELVAMSRSPRDRGSRVLPPTPGTRSGMGLAPRGASVLHQQRMQPGVCVCGGGQGTRTPPHVLTSAAG